MAYKKRTRNLYDSSSNKPFKLSRSKLESFIKCPQCFYLDRKLGIGRPSGFPFNLNKAIDTLLKKEFDEYRVNGKPHPLFIENNLQDIIPYSHENLDQWRDALRRGIEYEIPKTNIKMAGGIDDIWINQKTNELIIADYKATSKKDPVSINADWQISYKQQIEIYQWLFRKNGFKVSNTSYFVYCNAKTNVDQFDKKLNFDISLLPYEGNDSWVEKTIIKAYECLQSDNIPTRSVNCEYCQYVLTTSEVL